MWIYVKTESGAALPPVFALGASTGFQLLGNSELLAQETNTFLGPEECSLDQNQLLQMATLEKAGGPQPQSGSRDKKELPSGETTGKAGTLNPPYTVLQGSWSNGPQDMKGWAQSRIFLISWVSSHIS